MIPYGADLTQGFTLVTQGPEAIIGDDSGVAFGQSGPANLMDVAGAGVYQL